LQEKELLKDEEVVQLGKKDPEAYPLIIYYNLLANNVKQYFKLFSCNVLFIIIFYCHWTSEYQLVFVELCLMTRKAGMCYVIECRLYVCGAFSQKSWNVLCD